MNTRFYRLSLVFFCISLGSWAGNPHEWSLTDCLEYAKEHNLEIRQKKIQILDAKVDLKQSKQALLPSLSASSSVNLSNGKSEQSDGSYSNHASLSNQYGLQAGISLFDGLSNYHQIRLSEVNQALAEISVAETVLQQNILITEAYYEVLYANETLLSSKTTAETSQKQVDYSAKLLNAGSITRSDYNQVLAQQSSDAYAVVVAENNLSLKLLTLKQLLELSNQDDFSVQIPDITLNDLAAPVPNKSDVIQTVLTAAPEVVSEKLSVEAAQIRVSKAKSSYYPSLSASAGISTGYNSFESSTYNKQLNQNMGQQIGLSLSIPLFNKGTTQAAVKKAKLSLQTTQIQEQSTKKQLEKTIESLYLDIQNAQSNYKAAETQLQSAEESHRLIEAQFALGMKNTVELLAAKALLSSATQSFLQAKYSIVLSKSLLNIYQNSIAL